MAKLLIKVEDSEQDEVTFTVNGGSVTIARGASSVIYTDEGDMGALEELVGKIVAPEIDLNVDETPE